MVYLFMWMVLLSRFMIMFLRLICFLIRNLCLGIFWMKIFGFFYFKYFFRMRLILRVRGLSVVNYWDMYWGDILGLELSIFGDFCLRCLNLYLVFVVVLVVCGIWLLNGVIMWVFFYVWGFGWELMRLYRFSVYSVLSLWRFWLMVWNILFRCVLGLGLIYW